MVQEENEIIHRGDSRSLGCSNWVTAGQMRKLTRIYEFKVLSRPFNIFLYILSLEHVNMRALMVKYNFIENLLYLRE